MTYHDDSPGISGALRKNLWVGNEMEYKSDSGVYKIM